MSEKINNARMKLFISIIFFLISVNLALSQTVLYDSASVSQKHDSLYNAIGQNRVFPERYKLSILVALSHYPTLYNCEIIFQEDKIKTTLNTRPKFGSYFKKTQKRTYIIRINNSDKGEILLKEPNIENTPKVKICIEIGLTALLVNSK